MIAEALRPAAEALLVQVGLSPQADFIRIDGGGNNQVFRVESAGRRVALKVYFHHPEDKRNRLNAEYSFSSLLWAHGVKDIPEPLAADRSAQIGLYEFVEGERLAPGAVDADAVNAAVDFFTAANADTVRRDGKDLPIASEACFSVAAHLATVRRRLARLDGSTASETADLEAAAFVRDRVIPYWRRLEDDVLHAMSRLGIVADEELPAEARCISPSDFGFHNALREPSGRLRFVDFEYAGWDDPGKLTGDFFNQVQIPVPASLFAPFARRVAGRFPAAERNFTRFEILLPVYAVKWIAIMLNDFLPVGELRRSFAGDAGQALARKQAQLAKAQLAFARLSDKAPLAAVKV